MLFSRSGVLFILIISETFFFSNKTIIFKVSNLDFFLIRTRKRKYFLIIFFQQICHVMQTLISCYQLNYLHGNFFNFTFTQTSMSFFVKSFSTKIFNMISYIFNRREISETVEPWPIVLVILIIMGIGCLIFCLYTFVYKRRTFRRRRQGMGISMGISIIIYFLKN